MMQPAFDESTHTYRLGGVAVPGVTSLLQSAGLVDTAWFTERAKWRGSAIHAACHYDDEGALDPDSIKDWPDDYKYRLDAWRRFKAENSFVPHKIEHWSISEQDGFGGRSDRVGLFQSQEAIVDLKSGPVYDWVALQICGYSRLDNLERKAAGSPEVVHRRIGVRLKGDGSYSIREFPTKYYHRDLRIFMGIVALNNWKSAAKE